MKYTTLWPASSQDGIHAHNNSVLPGARIGSQQVREAEHDVARLAEQRQTGQLIRGVLLAQNRRVDALQ